MYYASVVLSTTLVCFLLNHEIIPDIPSVSYQPFALFIGRIVQTKGLLTMVKAFANTNLNLKIMHMIDKITHLSI